MQIMKSWAKIRKWSSHCGEYKTRNSATTELARDAAIQGHLRSSVIAIIDGAHMTFY